MSDRDKFSFCHKMHNTVILSVVGLALCLVLVNGEGCKTVLDCDYEHCDDQAGWHEVCTHGVLTGIFSQRTGICTCAQNGHEGAPCSSQGECTARCPLNNLNQNRFGNHCIDGECHCTFGVFGGGRK